MPTGPRRHRRLPGIGAEIARELVAAATASPWSPAPPTSSQRARRRDHAARRPGRGAHRRPRRPRRPGRAARPGRPSSVLTPDDPGQQRRLLHARPGQQGRPRGARCRWSRSTSSPSSTCAAGSCRAWSSAAAAAVLNVASHGGVPAAARPGGVRRRQGVRAVLHAQPGRRARGTGVTATTLCPGPVNTGFGERAGFTKEEADNALPTIMWVERRGGRQGRGRRARQGPRCGDPGHGQPGECRRSPRSPRARCWSRSWRSGTPACADPRHHRPPGCMVGAPRSREEPCVVRSPWSLAGSLALTFAERHEQHRRSGTDRAGRRRLPRVRPRTRPRSGRAARSPRSTRTPPGSGCGC